MRKPFTSILSALLIVAAFSLSASGCSDKSYGEVFDTQDELQDALADYEISLLFPTYMGETDVDSYGSYVMTMSESSGEVTGFKIYNFGSPFYVLLSAYIEPAEGLIGEDAAKVTEAGTVMTDMGEALLYTGKGYKDALYVIASLDIEGHRYEVRVTADKEMNDGEYVNAIYADNDKYQLAIAAVISVIGGLA